MTKTTRCLCTAAMLAATLALGACSSLSEPAKRATIGAGVGAVAGQVITGTTAGAAVGAAIGGVIGHEDGKRADRK